MKKYNWKQWAKCAGIRAARTVAQTAIATIGTSAVLSEVNWLMILSASVLAGIVSLLTSVAGLPELKSEAETGRIEETDEAKKVKETAKDKDTTIKDSEENQIKEEDGKNEHN